MHRYTKEVRDPGSEEANAAESKFLVHENPKFSNGNLVKTAQDFDFTACSEYDLNVGLGMYHFSQRYYCAVTKHGSIDDSQYGPCNESDTRE